MKRSSNTRKYTKPTLLAAPLSSGKRQPTGDGLSKLAELINHKPWSNKNNPPAIFSPYDFEISKLEQDIRDTRARIDFLILI